MTVPSTSTTLNAWSSLRAFWASTLLPPSRTISQVPTSLLNPWGGLARLVGFKVPGSPQVVSAREPRLVPCDDTITSVPQHFMARVRSGCVMNGSIIIPHYFNCQRLSRRRIRRAEMPRLDPRSSRPPQSRLPSHERSWASRPAFSPSWSSRAGSGRSGRSPGRPRSRG